MSDAAAKPLADARVFVSGPGVATSALTPRDGTIRFSDVEPGIYRLRIVLRGYDGVDVDDVEVLAGRRKIVEATLPRSLPEIGRVKARPSVAVTSVDVDEDNPVRRVSENLADALDKIAGVSVIRAPQTGTLTISLRNQDPSATIATAGGTPLVGGGASGLQSVAADLSSGVTVDNPNNPASLGGAVNFRTLEPTKTWQSQESFSYGSYERGSTAFSLSGSLRKLGIALQHASRSSEDRLTGLTFADTSGETYHHDGANARFANFLKLRYTAGPRLTLNATYLGGGVRTSPQCYDFVTNVPCGFGAGNTVRGDFNSASFGLSGQVGNVNVYAGAYGNTNHNLVDETRLYVSGSPEPYRNFSHGRGIGFYEYASVGFHRHTASLAYGGYNGTQASEPIGAFQSATRSSFRYGYLQFGDELKMSERWSASAGGGTSTTVASTSGAAWASVTLRPSKLETLAFSYQVGSGGTNFASQGSFGDPATATYNCPAREVRVQGPGDAPAPSTGTNTELTYDRRGKRGTLRVSAYDRVDRGGFMQAQFPLEVLGAAIPPGYVNALQQIWDRATICGGHSFDPSRIYVAEQISGSAVRYRGFDASGQVVLGRQVIALPSYSVNGAVLASADRRLLMRGSAYALGAQLPFRPLHRAGLTLDARQPRSGLEYLVDGRWTSANNPFALTSYVVVSAGVTWFAPRGRITALATNLFNTDTGLFATQEFVQPLGLRGGGTYVPVPTLLQPRSYTLLYSVRTGRSK